MTPAQTIANIIQSQLGVDVFEKTRCAEVIDCKRMLLVILRGTGMTLTKIAKQTGYSDHSSVIHQLWRHDDFMTTDREYKKNYEKIALLYKNFTETIDQKALISSTIEQGIKFIEKLQELLIQLECKKL